MKTILITGANGTLGAAFARDFLNADEDEYDVVMGVHNHRKQADTIAAEFPDRTSVLELDVTSPGGWQSAVDAILDQKGRLDVLINNAGFHRDHLLANMADEEWSMVIATNLDSVFHGCRSVVKPMLAQRFGRIINVASLSALLAPAGQTNYAAAKAGVVALTQSLAKEVARAGITVNALCPGYIGTEALASMDPEQKNRLIKQIPMRRVGQPEEVAAAAAFLASSRAGYITGSVLKIDGGIL